MHKITYKYSVIMDTVIQLCPTISLTDMEIVKDCDVCKRTFLTRNTYKNIGGEAVR